MKIEDLKVGDEVTIVTEEQMLKMFEYRVKKMKNQNSILHFEALKQAALQDYHSSHDSLNDQVGKVFKIQRLLRNEFDMKDCRYAVLIPRTFLPVSPLCIRKVKDYEVQLI